jgi:hypothetical protein
MYFVGMAEDKERAAIFSSCTFFFGCAKKHKRNGFYFQRIEAI